MQDKTLFSERSLVYKFPYKDESSEILFEGKDNFKKLLQQLNKFRKNGILCDAALATKDGASFRVHKSVMTCCSNYFKALFTTSLVEEKASAENVHRTSYLIPNISAEVLEMLINYAYTDEVDISKDNVNELFPAADEFGVVGIVEECKKFVLKNMTVENCIGIWIFGKEYSMPDLEKEAWRFITDNFYEVSINGEEFLHLKWDLLRELLDDNGLNVQNEIYVWTALKRWCQHKYRGRHMDLSRLLPCVRMAFLYIRDFKKIMYDPFIVRHLECRSYINMVSKYILNELNDISRDVLDKAALSIFTPRHPYEIILSSGGCTINGVTNVLEAYDCRADLWKMNEIYVWTALKRWCQHKYRGRHRNLSRLLPCVRMAFLYIRDFKKIMYDPFIVRHLECRSYINMVSKYILNELNDISRDVLDKAALSIFTPRHPYEIILSSGGCTINGVTNVLEAYDYRADLWKMLFDGGFLQRAYHQIVHLGDYIYVLGGSTGANCLSSCWRLHLKSLSFEEISPMQAKRCYLSAAVLHDRIYAIGGFDGYHRLDTVEYYDQDLNQWIYVSPMNERRSDASASSLRDRIFVVGGFDGFDFLQSAECYFGEFNQWLRLPPMNRCRSGVGCVAMEDAVYAIGGYDGKSRLRTVEKYSLIHRQWFATKPMNRARSNFAVAVLEKKIYVMGGYEDENDTIVDEAEYFDPVRPAWHTVAALNIGRSGLSSCTFSGVSDRTPYIRDDRFRCVLKNTAREETIDLEDYNPENIDD